MHLGIDITASPAICMRFMRTTLSLDEDVALELQRLQRKRGDASLLFWKAGLGAAMLLIPLAAAAVQSHYREGVLATRWRCCASARTTSCFEVFLRPASVNAYFLSTCGIVTYYA